MVRTQTYWTYATNVWQSLDLGYMNLIRDCIGDIAVQVWIQVGEPIVREAETQVSDSGLRLNLGVRGVW